MDPTKFSRPLPLKDVQVTDAFWKHEMELVRTEVIPYQWEALNDRVPGASPSWCMHNFRAAARLMARRRLEGSGVKAAFTMRGFEQLPEDPSKPEPDAFYGFVFQDTDFSKWVEAVGYSLISHPDPELEATADGAIDIVCAAQYEDGYLDTFYILGGIDKRFTHLRDHHELYCLGHLIEGAISYYQATGKDKLLQAACRYADCVDRHFGREEGKTRGYPGHEIAEMALVRLYDVTREERYLELASYFVDERGQSPNYFLWEEEKYRPNGPMAGFGPKRPIHPEYYQAHLPVRSQDEIVGHAVRAMYLYSGVADIARLKQDEELLAACERIWKSAVEQKMYITGGVGSTHLGEAFTYPYDLPNDSAYSETCAAIGLVFFARRMLQIHADRRYGDAMELALYNTVLDGMALDGKSFFYVNPLEVVPEAVHRDERLHHVKPVRQKWFGCACCPPNIARLVASLQAYAYTLSEDTLYTHLYVKGQVSAALNGTPITLRAECEMPWKSGAVYTVKAEGTAHGTLAFRLPCWCRKPVVTAPGKEQKVIDGYCYVTGDWQDGDTVTLDLPMHLRVMKADARVREDAGQVAIMYGPICYCGESADNGEDLHLVRVDPAAAADKAVISSTDAFGVTVSVIDLPATRVEPAEQSLYAEWSPDAEKPITLRLIPYFCWANRGEGEMRVWWHI